MIATLITPALVPAKPTPAATDSPPATNSPQRRPHRGDVVGELTIPRLHLSVRLALTGNRRFFAESGFRETVMHSHPGFTEPTFVDMEKSLV